MSKLNVNSRVNETGATSYLQSVEASRRLREVKFEPQHCYCRAFLKYATTADTRPGKDAEFVTNQKPSHVFISDVLGEYVYNPNDEEATAGGYKINPKYSCLEAMTEIAKTIQEICKDVSLASEEEEFEKAFEAEDNTFKLSWAKSYIAHIQEVIVQTRPEYSEVFGLKEFCSLMKNFDRIILPVIKQMIKTFSSTRTDLITWVAKSQTVSIGERFSIGSLKASEEDDGEQLDTCYKMAALSEEISVHNFMQTAEGKIFPKPDMRQNTFRDAYRKWANVFKSGRTPWSRPTDTPVHFCLNVECTLDKRDLIRDSATKQPAYSFGFYRSSLGEGGKMNKILGAAKTGTANDDPDYILIFMGYTSSDDAQTASRNMTVSDINMDKVIFSPDQITDAFNTVAQDTQKRKVRLYDEFPLNDRLADFRNYIIDEKVLDWLDTSKFSDALEILGIKTKKTDAESLSASLYDGLGAAPSVSQNISPMEAAAIQASQPVPSQPLPPQLPPTDIELVPAGV